MRVLELSLRNYRVFEQVDLELPARVIGIFGENGSGKSTLMESIAFALYGADAARTKKNEIRTQGVLTDCEARLVFEHAGTQYEVRRAIKGKGHTPEAELFVGGLLLASGATEVDGEVQRLLHMDLRVFKASAYAEQKQLDAFSEVTAGKRKEMVLRLLGIRPVDEARMAAKRQARVTSQSAEQLVGAVPDLADLEARLKEAKDVAKEARDRAKVAGEALKDAAKAAKARRAEFEAADLVRQQVDKLDATRMRAREESERLSGQRDELAARVEALRAALGEVPGLEEEQRALVGARDLLDRARSFSQIAEALATAEAELAQLPAVDVESALAGLQQADAALREAERTAAKAESGLERARERLATAQETFGHAGELDPTKPCPTCGQALGEGYAGYLSHCREEVTTAKKVVSGAEKAFTRSADERRRAQERFDRAAEDGERARRAADGRERLTGRVGDLRAQAAEASAPFEGMPPDVPALEANAKRAEEVGRRLAGLASDRKHLEQAELDFESLRARLDALAEELGALDEQTAVLAFDPKTHARLRGEREQADEALERARGAEQAAEGRLNDARQAVSRLEGEIEQARETSAKIDELRSEARYAERVSLLLDGFRDHLVTRIGPELSRESEALFGELTGHEYDDLRIRDEDLRIEIADGDAYFPIERFSGSETDLANLALRVAISMHLSRVSGADVGMMVLDEVLGSLDAERKDLMVRAMGRLAGRFHQLFVITHAEQVKDQFPASIEVRRVGRRRSTAMLV